MLVLLALACAPDPGEGKVKAEIVATPAAAPAAAPAPAAGATVLKVDHDRSSLGAIGAKVTATHPIVFHDFEGSIGLNGDTPASVSFVAQMATLEANVPKLTEHLKTEDFFDVAKFPTSTFTSTQIVAATGDDAKLGTHRVTGDLTIHGVTKRVAFPATITVTPTEVTASTEFVINRKDFAIVYPGKPDDLVKDNVDLKVAFVAPRS